MDKRWSFDLNRLGGFAVREKVFCFLLVFGFRCKGESVSILYFFGSLF